MPRVDPWAREKRKIELTPFFLTNRRHIHITTQKKQRKYAPHVQYKQAKQITTKRRHVAGPIGQEIPPRSN